MSHMITCKTNMKNRDTIISALVELGVPQEIIVVSNDPLKLQGYGRQSTNVEILVRRTDLHKGYGDVGFVKNDDGTYSCIVDDIDDTGSLARSVGVNKFSGAVNQWYSALTAQTALKKKGLLAKIQKQDNKLVVIARN
jgi:hypothetical protein